MDDLIADLRHLAKETKTVALKIDIGTKQARITELENDTLRPGFWQDEMEAKTVMQELSLHKGQLESLQKIQKQLTTLEEFVATTSKDELELLEQEFRTQLQQAQNDYIDLEMTLFLSGEYDAGNAIVSVHAGQGGVEAMDWSSMLYRMYTRFVDRQGWEYQLVSESRGEEAGIKTATILVRGSNAYGYLKKEAGTHRLVRQSPFNADNLRQTSFALVEVLPELRSNSSIEIKDDDLEWSFFRSSGKGGQNVNKVSTAVRLRHIPTNLVIESQSQRSQSQNRELALTLLKSKLWERAEALKQEKISQLKGGRQQASWGTQIRNYVLHPYNLVKDVRTGVETSDTTGVLDGDLLDFIKAEIKL